LTHAVEIFVASFNTRSWTELTLRFLAATQSCAKIRVGDSGSRDGSLEMLEELRSAGQIESFEQSEGRPHGGWLDHWIRTSTSEYVLFVDSDMIFWRRGWLDAMMAAAVADDATMVAAEMLPEQANAIEPENHKRVRLAQRPAPWLLLCHTARVRDLDASFLFDSEESASVAEGLIAYDVAARVHEAARAVAGGTIVMPRRFTWGYTHVGGRSWRQKSRDLRADVIYTVARIRLSTYRGRSIA
jgi:hypothetical protein